MVGVTNASKTQESQQEARRRKSELKIMVTEFLELFVNQYNY